MTITVKAFRANVSPHLAKAAAAHGVTPPVAPKTDTWDKVGADLNTTLEAIAAAKAPPIVAPPPAPVVVAPPPVVSPPAPPSGSWPSSVAAKGLGAVYDLRNTAGVLNAPNKTPTANAASLPAGSTLRGPNLMVTASANFDRWDFTGLTLYIDGDISVSFTDCKFKPDPTSGQYVFSQGTLSAGKPVVTLTRCLLDFTCALPPQPSETDLPPGTIRPPQTGFTVAQGGDLHLIDCALKRAAVTVFNWDGPGTLTMLRCYISCFAQNLWMGPAPYSNHSEIGAIFGGTFTATECLFDNLDGLDTAVARFAHNTDKPGGPTGMFLMSAYVHPVVARFERCCILIRGLINYYAMQALDNTYGIDVTFTDNVVQLPVNVLGNRGGYMGYPGSTGVHGSGNIDFDTSAPAADLNRGA